MGADYGMIDHQHKWCHQHLSHAAWTQYVSARQAEVTESSAHGRGYLKKARKDQPGERFVTVLFDKGKQELRKCIPLTSLCIQIVGGL